MEGLEAAAVGGERRGRPAGASYRITRDRGGGALGDAWLARVFEGFARVLEEETGDAFRIRLERVEEGTDGG
jgi:hypothetical protein